MFCPSLNGIWLLMASACPLAGVLQYQQIGKNLLFPYIFNIYIIFTSLKQVVLFSRLYAKDENFIPAIVVSFQLWIA